MDIGKSVQLPLPRARSSQISRMPRRASFRIPDKFKDGADADEDVTAPTSKRSRYMNQSFISLIANVGSSANFEPHFTLKDPGQSAGLGDVDPSVSLDGSKQKWRDPRTAVQEDIHTREEVKAQPSERRPSRSVPDFNYHLQDANLQDDSFNEDMCSSQILTPRIVSSKVTEGSPERPEMAASTGPSSPLSQYETQSSPESDGPLPITAEVPVDKPSIGLEERLFQVFGLKTPEKVISDYPCWLLQSVLLQGHMYITPRHICYYAYLPRNDDRTTKSGHLWKRGRQNPRYNRYWFVLKGNVLSYYSDRSNLYFPRGNIDLKRALSAEIRDMKQAKATAFSVTTAQGVYHFKAESAPSAREWVKQIQKVIFRSRNDSDSVKILLPMSNIMDIESNPVLEFADTFRIRIIDNDETFAIDEYFFSFFNGGQDVIDMLRFLVYKNGAKPAHASACGPETGNSKGNRELSYGSGVAESTKRTANESKKRSVRATGPPSPSSSSDDVDVTVDASPALEQPINASQILQRSDLFQIAADATSENTQRFSNTENRADNLERTANTTDSGSHSHFDSHSSSKARSNSYLGSSVDSPSSSASRVTVQPTYSFTSLRELVKASNEPLNKASGIAGSFWAKSQAMRNALSAESKGYFEKVSGMWAGQPVHYDDDGTSLSVDDGHDSSNRVPFVKQIEDFRAYFALPDNEKLIATYSAWLARNPPAYGTLYLGSTKLCFQSELLTTGTKMILPLQDIETIDKETGNSVIFSGLTIVIRGHEEVFFDFGRRAARDDLAITLLQCLESAKDLPESSRALSRKERLDVEAAKAEYELLEYARQSKTTDCELLFQSIAIDPENEAPPILFDDDQSSVVDLKPDKPQNITCLTIGSQGDVQPYIALCKGLIAEGHEPKIATHAEFEPWIRYHGIGFEPIAGDPQEIMRLCVEHDMFTVSFIREVSSKFRGWMDQLLESSWKACQGSDILIESPSAMAGVHVAEALEIPYFRSFTMPWTQTRAYPHAFIVPSQKRGGSYNKLTYMLFEKVFWQAQAGQVNQWRVRSLGLAPTSFDKMQINKAPFMYNFSPSVVPPPLDFNPWIRVTGYWFLDEGKNYEPSKELVDFIAQARKDCKKLVYVGFGSIVLDNPAALTKTVIESVLKADVRCILSKGWSQRLGGPETSEPEFPLPPEIFQIKRAPHDWLFTQIDAAAHHGGAGTTGASLRAGIPTIVRPFFGDQWFFGSRVEDLGVGKCLRIINTSVFARVLWEVTNNERIIMKAKLLGEQIRAEDGVGKAIQALYRDLEYAKSLVKTRARPAEKIAEEKAEKHSDESSESWTMVDEGKKSS